MLIHATAAGFIALNHAMRFQSWQALMKKLLSLCLLVLMATRCCSLLPPQRGLLLQGMLSTQAMSPLLTGNSKTTSLPVSFLYTDPKVSSLYSVEFLSLGSKYTCKHHAQFRCPAHCMTQLVRVPK